MALATKKCSFETDRHVFLGIDDCPVADCRNKMPLRIDVKISRNYSSTRNSNNEFFSS